MQEKPNFWLPLVSPRRVMCQQTLSIQMKNQMCMVDVVFPVTNLEPGQGVDKGEPTWVGLVIWHDSRLSICSIEIVRGVGLYLASPV